MDPRVHGLVPFAFGAAANLAALDLAPFGIPLAAWPADRASSERFHALLSRMNAHAFGGMGMPMWVQLDLAVLPSAFVGWAAPPDLLPAPLRDALGVRADDAWVPVAEALTVPTAAPGRWMSASMASVLPGLQLGYWSKRLSLAAVRAREALGVTQIDNPAVRTHLRFGPLWVELGRVPFHSRPDTTFIYRLDLERGPARPPPTRWVDDLAGAEGMAVVAVDGGRLGLAGP